MTGKEVDAWSSRFGRRLEKRNDLRRDRGGVESGDPRGGTSGDQEVALACQLLPRLDHDAAGDPERPGELAG